MKVPATYKCDVCQKVRDSDSNHWAFGYVFRSGSLLLLGWKEAVSIDGAVMTRDSDGAAHLCGQDHAIQWVSQQLSKPVTTGQ